ncbi:iron-containing redox enzyme family protein [Streptomyces sp. NPDC005805]|uniref:iron-containing redox enzyme family protein n=1 Tax=Streptomyces sp. NPDC005805 TaxID=3157068 RepID=UPI0033DF0E10
MTAAATHRAGPADGSAPLPGARGELSDALLRALRGPVGGPVPDPGAAAARHADGWDEDLHLALHLCYEPHYRGFTGTDPEWEWDPGLLGLRRALEARFLDVLRASATGPADPWEALDALLVEQVDGSGVSHRLRDDGTREQVREYAAQRSLYHLKEADPHAWVIPRLRGRAKAAFTAVEFDEFGGGRAERVHAELFADLMRDLGLDASYGRYTDAAGPEMLAVVNMMSLFGLHRSLRGALVGHFAHVETTSSPASRRLAEAMRRTGAGPAAEHFYDEHVTADAVHEQVVRRDVVGGLLADEPSLGRDVAFGVAATEAVEARFGVAVLAAWDAGRSSLRVPLTAAVPPGA